MRLRAVSAAAALTLTLAGCASAAAVSTSPGGGGSIGGGGGADFAARARQVAAHWTGSALQRAWLRGYFPITDPTVLPQGAWHSGGDKEAAAGGRFTIRVPLPTLPPREKLRFADGGTLELPTLSPMEAVQPEQTVPCPGSCADTLTVTGGSPTTLRVPTSRGLVTVPAWSLRLAGYATPLVVPAVRPSLIQARDGLVPGDVSTKILPGWLGTVSADGRTLHLTVGHGDCDTRFGARVYETADAVVVGGWEVRKPGICDLAMRSGPATVRLAAPLGTRVVLDATTGEPELPTASRR